MWKWISALYAFSFGVGLEPLVTPIMFLICVTITAVLIIMYFLVDPLDALKVWLRRIWETFFRKISFAATPNYTPDVTAMITEKYKMGENLEDIAKSAGKTVASIRGKLVSEKVYSQFKTQRMNAIQRGVMDGGRTLTPLELKSGQEYRFDDLLSYLNKAGYLRVNRVSEQGCYSVKGGVVTVLPFGFANSISIDYFGDTVETITDDVEKTELPTVVIDPFSPSGNGPRNVVSSD